MPEQLKPAQEKREPRNFHERVDALARTARVSYPSNHRLRQRSRVVRGIRRTIGTAQKQKSPATAGIVGAMLSHCPKTTAGKRDRALLALGFAGAFRRSELAMLTMDDLRHVAEGLQIKIRKSKTDQESGGQTIAVPHGRHIKPVQALCEWLEAAGITEGPVFVLLPARVGFDPWLYPISRWVTS